jgi:hypothetical protein
VSSEPGAGQGPFTNPQQFSVNLVDDDGSVQKLSLTDRPENRGMLAVKKEFPDPAELESIGFRMLTFPAVLKMNALKEMGLIRQVEENQTEIHDAVVVALAQAPFKKSGSLDEKAFIELVKLERERIEAEESN